MDWREFKNVQTEDPTAISAVQDGNKIVITKKCFSPHTGEPLADETTEVQFDMLNHEIEHSDREIERATQTKEAAEAILADI